MSRSDDPYDALASIFLPGGGKASDGAPAAVDAPDPLDPAETGEITDQFAAHDSAADETMDADEVDTGTGRQAPPIGGDMPVGTTRPHGGRPLGAGSVQAPASGSTAVRSTTPAMTSTPTSTSTPAGGSMPTAGIGTLGHPGAVARVGGPSRGMSDRPRDADGDAARGAPATVRRGGGGDGGAVELELLVPGHLPIRAAAWLVPCVRAIAGRDRAVGFLRCETGSVELELHGPAPAPPPARTLAETIDALRGPVRRWFLRPPRELDLESMAGAQPDRVTILTGGDPVAVASAWEIARRVITGADEARWARPQLGLAVVGVPRRQADLIAEQLDRITRERLGTSVDLRCCVPRIEPGAAPAVMVRGEAIDADPIRLSSLIRGERFDPTAGDRPRRDDEPPQVPDLATTGRATPGDDPADAAPMGALLGSGLADTEADGPGVPFVFPRATRGLPRVDASPAHSPSHSVSPSSGSTGDTLARIIPARAMPAGPNEPGEADVAEPAPRAAGSGPPSRPEYARHVPGLRALAARSPAHPEIELAVDAEGGLHVLGGVAAVRDLPLVAEWALTHAELLALACPDREIDASRRPQGHVFTDDPLAVSDLHQSQLHLHLLAEIEVDGHRGWFVSPLHRPRS